MAPHAAPDSPAPAHVAGYWKRRSASLFRWLHTYVSMASFGLLFFFAVTGLTLNHADWFFGEQASAVRHRGRVDATWVAPGNDTAIAKLEVVEHLRRTHGVRGLVGEFRIEETSCTVAFKGPGYTADAVIERATGSYDLAETRMGFVAIINDLHKARDSGPGWSLVVDLSAVLMILVSLTGLVLIYFVKRRFVTGTAMAIGGAIASWLLYLWLVP